MDLNYCRILMKKKILLPIVILLVLSMVVVGCGDKGEEKDIEGDGNLVAEGQFEIEKPEKKSTEKDRYDEEAEEEFEGADFELELGEKSRLNPKEVKGLYLDDVGMLEFLNEFTGKKAPDFEMENLEGEKVKISDFEGENVILQFMGSWCGACVEATETNDDFNTKYEGAKIISIGVSESKESLLEMTKASEVKNTEFFIPISEESLDLYNVFFVPVYFYIDSEGYVQMILKGNAPLYMLEEYADKSFY